MRVGQTHLKMSNNFFGGMLGGIAGQAAGLAAYQQQMQVLQSQIMGMSNYQSMANAMSVAESEESRKIREFDWNRAADLNYLRWWYQKESSR